MTFESEYWIQNDSKGEQKPTCALRALYCLVWILQVSLNCLRINISFCLRLFGCCLISRACFFFSSRCALFMYSLWKRQFLSYRLLYYSLVIHASFVNVNAINNMVAIPLFWAALWIFWMSWQIISKLQYLSK